MSGRTKSLSAKRRPVKGKKPNATRQRQLSFRHNRRALGSDRLALLRKAAKAQGLEAQGS